MTSYNICGLCLSQSKSSYAMFLCGDCDERFCERCSLSHYETFTSHHLIFLPFEPSEFDRFQQNFKKEDTNFKYYCKEHETIYCHCYPWTPQYFKNIVPLDKVSENARDSPLIAENLNAYSDIKQRLSKLLQSKEDTLERIENSSSMILQEITSIKTKLVQQINIEEQNLIEDLAKTKDDIKTEIDHIKSVILREIAYVDALSDQIGIFRDHATNDELFLSLKKDKKTIKQLNSNVEAMIWRFPDIDIKLKPTTLLLESLGTIMQFPPKSDCRRTLKRFSYEGYIMGTKTVLGDIVTNNLNIGEEEECVKSDIAMTDECIMDEEECTLIDKEKTDDFKTGEECELTDDTVTNQFKMGEECVLTDNTVTGQFNIEEAEFELTDIAASDELKTGEDCVPNETLLSNKLETNEECVMSDVEVTDKNKTREEFGLTNISKNAKLNMQKRREENILTDIAVTDDNKLLLCNHHINYPKIYVFADCIRYIGEFIFSCIPCSLAVISGTDKALVTFPEENSIQYIDTKAMTKGRTFKPGCKVFAICASSDNIFIAGDNEILVLDINGTFEKRISVTGLTSTSSIKICSFHNGILCNGTLSLRCIDLEGACLHQYHIPGNEAIYIDLSITMDELGKVYAGCKETREILRFSPEGKFIDVVLNPGDFIKLPSSMTFNKECSKLFVINTDLLFDTALIYECSK